MTRAADTGIAIDESIPGECETVPSERFAVSPLSASVILVVVAAGMVAADFVSSYVAHGTQLSLTDWLRPREIAGHLANTILVLARSPAPVLLLALLLELWLPVTPNQRDLTRGFWQDTARYEESYWSRIPGLWVHGDFARIDADGFWYIHGQIGRAHV